MEEKKLYIRDSDTIQEFATFVSKGQSWQADGGCHDDMVMNCVSICMVCCNTTV